MKGLASVIVAGFVLWCQVVFAGSSISGAGKGVAVQGFDVVAYFTQGKPVKGSPQFTHEWAGTVWWFSTAEHRDAFAAQPDKYAPQYGGHCALSIVKGKTTSGSGEAWHIDQGKLYLNHDANAKRVWMKEMFRNIISADGNWPAVKARLEGE